MIERADLADVRAQTPPPADDARPAERVGVDFDRDVVALLGLPFDVLDGAQAVERIREAAFANRRCFVSTPNLNFAVSSHVDPAFRDSVLHSDLSLVDGMPLVWLARAMGLPIRERVPGAGLFEALMAHRGPPITVYFFGGAVGIAEKACRRVNALACGIRCVGHDTPGFGSVDEMSGDERIERINASGAQFIVVSLGARKGQAWIERNAPRLSAPVLCHLGAVVNIAAGTIKRAPRGWQNAGLEWLWRVKEEPALWRRYWADGLALAATLRRVLPNAQARRPDRSAGDPVATSLGAKREGRTAVIAPRGAWRHGDLGPLRAALKQASQESEAVRVDLGGLTAADCAFVALLMLARGRWGSDLTFVGVEPPALRALRACDAEYLLAADGGRGAAGGGA